MRAILCTVLAAALLGCGPIGPFSGGELSGDVGTHAVADWSFLDEHETVQLETRPDDPYSINIWIGHLDGSPYVVTSLILGEEDPAERAWVQHVQSEPRVRLRVDGVLYERLSVRVEDPAEAEAVRRMMITKYEVEPGQDGRTEGAWIFRLDPR